MSGRFISLLLVLFLFFVSGQSIDSVNERQFLAFSLDSDFPEMDGSAVDPCGIFPFPTPDTDTVTTGTPTKTTTKTKPITKKQVAATTKRPAVQSPTRAPVRPQPQPAGPVRHSNPSLSLLLHLLTNNGRQAASSNRFHSQPMGGQRRRGQSSSESDELPFTRLNRAGRANWNRRRMGSSSSEESSD